MSNTYEKIKVFFRSKVVLELEDKNSLMEEKRMESSAPTYENVQHDENNEIYGRPCYPWNTNIEVIIDEK